MKSRRHLSAWVSIKLGTVLTLTVSCAVAPRQSLDGQSLELRALSQWNAHVLQVFRVGRADAEITDEMKHLVQFTGTYILGGSGTYQRVYVIDDVFQIVAVFDVHERLLAIPVVGPRTKWLRLPDGQMIQGG